MRETSSFISKTKKRFVWRQMSVRHSLASYWKDACDINSTVEHDASTAEYVACICTICAVDSVIRGTLFNEQ